MTRSILVPSRTTDSADCASGFAITLYPNLFRISPRLLRFSSSSSTSSSVFINSLHDVILQACAFPTQRNTAYSIFCKINAVQLLIKKQPFLKRAGRIQTGRILNRGRVQGYEPDYSGNYYVQFWTIQGSSNLSLSI